MKTKKILLAISFLTLFLLFYFNSTAVISYTYVNVTVFSTDTIEGTNYYELDLNNDNIIDFKIGAKFFYNWDTPHPPLENHVVFIEAVDQNKIGVGPYQQNDTIGESLKFYNFVNIFGGYQGIGGIGAWSSYYHEPNIFYYIGLKFFHDNNIYFGWIKLKTDSFSFTIESYAYNNTPGQYVLAGQN